MQAMQTLYWLVSSLAGNENGAPSFDGAPSARTDRLPGFTTFVVDGLRESRGKALTTCPSRLIAVSEYRGPSVELQVGGL